MSKLRGGKCARKLKKDAKGRRRAWQKNSSAGGVEKPKRFTTSCKNPGTKSKAQRQREREVRKEERQDNRAKKKLLRQDNRANRQEERDLIKTNRKDKKETKKNLKAIKKKKSSSPPPLYSRTKF